MSALNKLHSEIRTFKTTLSARNWSPHTQPCSSGLRLWFLSWYNGRQCNGRPMFWRSVWMPSSCTFGCDIECRFAVTSWSPTKGLALLLLVVENFGLQVFFIIWLAPRASKMSHALRFDWPPERARWTYLARSGLPVARSPRHLKLNPWTMQSFSRCSVWKCFLECSENSQHLPKEKERDMKSSWGSVNFVLSYKFNECDVESVSCPAFVSNLREINFVKLVHLRVTSSNKFIRFPTFLRLFFNLSVVKAAVSVWCISKKCFPQVRRRSRRSFSCFL